VVRLFEHFFRPAPARPAAARPLPRLICGSARRGSAGGPECVLLCFPTARAPACLRCAALPLDARLLRPGTTRLAGSLPALREGRLRLPPSARRALGANPRPAARLLWSTPSSNRGPSRGNFAWRPRPWASRGLPASDPALRQRPWRGGRAGLFGLAVPVGAPSRKRRAATTSAPESPWVPSACPARPSALPFEGRRAGALPGSPGPRRRGPSRERRLAQSGLVRVFRCAGGGAISCNADVLLGVRRSQHRRHGGIPVSRALLAVGRGPCRVLTLLGCAGGPKARGSRSSGARFRCRERRRRAPIRPWVVHGNVGRAARASPRYLGGSAGRQRGGAGPGPVPHALERNFAALRSKKSLRVERAAGRKLLMRHVPPAPGGELCRPDGQGEQVQPSRPSRRRKCAAVTSGPSRLRGHVQQHRGILFGRPSVPPAPPPSTTTVGPTAAVGSSVVGS